MYQKIRDLREDRDLKQREIAAYLNCSQRTYSNYELGQRDIPTDVLIKLADYYDVSDFNENMDAIDAQMALTEQETENISGKIGNSEDAETGSVFSKLNTIVENTSKAQSFIKSILCKGLCRHKTRYRRR